MQVTTLEGSWDHLKLTYNVDPTAVGTSTPGRLVGGDFVVITDKSGKSTPFSMSVNQRTGFTVSVQYDDMEKKPSVFQIGQWAVDRLVYASNKLKSVSMAGAIGAFPVNSTDGEIPGTPLRVPLTKAYFIPSQLKGDTPLGTFTHPVTGKRWAIWGTFEHWRILFKIAPYEKSWWEKFKDFVGGLVAKVVKFVKDVVNWIKDLVICNLAKDNVDTLSQLASGAIMLSNPAAGALLNAGLSHSDLQKAEEGLSGAGVKLLAEKIIDTVCKVPPKPAVTYPKGSIAAFDSAIQKYRIASPIGLSGEATHREVALEATLPSGVTLVPMPEYQKKTGGTPWYKAWQTYAIVGGVVAVGAGAFYLKRRGKKRRRR